MTPAEVERLALAKYLLRQGLDQARQPQPMATSALLQFHDAIEIVLRVAVEHLNALPKNEALAAYFTSANAVLSTHIPPTTLPEEGPILRLNKARVSLKHYGILPRQEDLSEFAETAKRFFEATFPMVFSVALESVSILDFVRYSPARDHLKRANEAIERPDEAACLKECSLALDCLLEDYEDRKRGTWHDSPFEIGRHLHVPSEFQYSVSSDRGNLTRPVVDMLKYLKTLTGAFEELSEAFKIVSFGIDYRKYVRFSELTPRVIHMMQGPPQLNDRRDPKVVTPDQLRFCVDFVLDTALHLQQFDFDATARTP